MAISLPQGIDAHLGAMAALASELEGHLTPREARFLALLGSVPTARGDILEIGSFKGKSTILLAKSAAFCGEGRVSAVDPLTMPSVTDPKDGDRATLPRLFQDNLVRHGVSSLVDFHQMTSGALAPSWRRPLRLLWIDGDHTWKGAAADFDGFAGFVQPGGIVALHDVLNRFEGPARVMGERVLASERFGACGLVGSIGWGQVATDAGVSDRWLLSRERLRSRLSALVPCLSDTRAPSFANRLAFRILRARVPHAELPAADWARLVERAN